MNFKISAVGLWLHGTYKGYLYSEGQPVRLKAKPGGIEGLAYEHSVKPVEGHWYIYSSRD